MFTIDQIFAPQGPQVQQAPAAPAAASANQPDPFAKSPTPDPVEPTAPMDQYKDLFIVDPNAPQEDPNAPVITYDEKLLGEKVAGMQFLGTSEEIVALAAKASQGDAAALMMLVNSASQQAYAQGAKLAANISNRAVQVGNSQVQSKLPNAMRSQLVTNELAALNPALQHPAMSQLTQSTQAAFEQKFPDATPSQIAKMTNEYFSNVLAASKVTAPADQVPAGRQLPGNQDFSDFFGRKK